VSTSPGADLGDAFAAQPMNLVLAIKAIIQEINGQSLDTINELFRLGI